MVEKLKRVDKDKLVMVFAILYVVLPVVLFFLGWLKTIYAIIACLIVCLLAYGMHREICDGSVHLLNKNNQKYWSLVTIISGFWIYFSGIGSLCYQNGDFWVRNPIYRDLSTYSWPIIYDLSKESDLVQQIAGNGKVAFSYYFTWWLPPAFLSKVFHLVNFSRNIVLFGWALLGILLIIYCINRLLGKCSYITVIILLIFSGLDVVIYYMNNMSLPLTEHIEWWNAHFQYSSNTTQLFWVFNQAIPVWMLVCVLLQLKNNKYIMGLCALTFAYSPWATFGMIPIAISGSIGKNKKIKDIFQFANIGVPLIMLLVYGTFYAASSGSDGGAGLIFLRFPDEKRSLLCTFFVFIFLEAGIYFAILGDRPKKHSYYWISLLELILIPIFYMGDRNFVMRASVPALFLLMTYVIRYLDEEKKEKTMQKKLLIAVLLVGMMTPLTEFNRSLKESLASEDVLMEDVHSFADIQTDAAVDIKTIQKQFFIYDYKESIFFKYLGKNR